MNDDDRFQNFIETVARIRLKRREEYMEFMRHVPESGLMKMFKKPNSQEK